MGTRAWLDVPGLRTVDGADLSTLDDIAHELALDPDELATIISIESGWHPEAHNAIPAGGLIGFLPSTMKAIGWDGTPSQFFELTVAEQLPYVAKFYSPWKGRIARRGDLYMATFWPSGVGTPDDNIIAAKEGPNVKVWEQNPGLRAPEDGPITSGSVRAVLSRAMARAEARPRYIPQTFGTTTGKKVGRGGGVLLLAAFGLLLWSWRRRRRINSTE